MAVPPDLIDLQMRRLNELWLRRQHLQVGSNHAASTKKVGPRSRSKPRRGGGGGTGDYLQCCHCYNQAPVHKDCTREQLPASSPPRRRQRPLPPVKPINNRPQSAPCARPPQSTSLPWSPVSWKVDAVHRVHAQSADLLRSCSPSRRRHKRPLCDTNKAAADGGSGRSDVAQQCTPHDDVSLTAGNLLEAGPGQVCMFLRLLGLGAYAPGFAKRGVVGVDLLACEDEDLAACGVDFRPHRLRLLEEIARLRGAPAAALDARGCANTAPQQQHDRALQVEDADLHDNCLEPASPPYQLQCQGAAASASAATPAARVAEAQSDAQSALAGSVASAPPPSAAQSHGSARDVLPRQHQRHGGSVGGNDQAAAASSCSQTEGPAAVAAAAGAGAARAQPAALDTGQAAVAAAASTEAADRSKCHDSADTKDAAVPNEGRDSDSDLKRQDSDLQYPSDEAVADRKVSTNAATAVVPAPRARGAMRASMAASAERSARIAATSAAAASTPRSDQGCASAAVAAHTISAAEIHVSSSDTVRAVLPAVSPSAQHLSSAADQCAAAAAAAAAAPAPAVAIPPAEPLATLAVNAAAAAAAAAAAEAAEAQPTIKAARATWPASSAAAAAAAAVPRWSCFTDPASGQPYFFDAAAGVSTWDVPEEFAPASPAERAPSSTQLSVEEGGGGEGGSDYSVDFEASVGDGGGAAAAAEEQEESAYELRLLRGTGSSYGIDVGVSTYW
ncbi:hypothetical protein JKP88DRAFT_295901 [Tribonema minus]|uniref:SAM domain-containing protein n=1 Tax=Tribonema minus TaxID=303371 RepID=A0A836CN96_9STRA|nr:hypothetical protein JKP88DRAFT_295901 [Tribonema minus]